MAEQWTGRWEPEDSDSAPGIVPLVLGARVETSHRDRCVLAVVTGALDMTSVTGVRDRLHAHVYAGARHLVLDLSGVTFMDSVGLSLLVGLDRIVSARNGTLHLAACPAPVVELMEITSMTAAFTVHETVAEAEAATAEV
jgi:anti-sigma B factor antagonist